MAMVCVQSADRLTMGEKEMHDFFSLHLLADVALMISQGKLCLGLPSILDRDDEKKKKKTAVPTTFGTTWVQLQWVSTKKRSPRPRRPTFHTHKQSSDLVGGFVQKKKQGTLEGVADKCKKRPRVDSAETQEFNGISKKPKKKSIGNLVGPSELPTIFKDKVLEMSGQEVRLVVEKELSATDMNPSQSRLSIPKSQILTVTNFLSDQEMRILDTKQGIKVSLVDPSLQVHQGLQLKRWNYGSKTFSYVLTERWNLVSHPCKLNGLKKGCIVQLWSFRVDGNLCFCLMKV